jgi:hypothetical protein
MRARFGAALLFALTAAVPCEAADPNAVLNQGARYPNTSIKSYPAGQSYQAYSLAFGKIDGFPIVHSMTEAWAEVASRIDVDIEDPIRNRRDIWDVDCTRDLMTDEKSCSISRNAAEDGVGGLFITDEFVCILGDDYPGREAMLRIGKNKPWTTFDDRCFDVATSKKIMHQLTGNQQIIIRLYRWPYNYPYDVLFSSAGLEQALRLREWLRKNSH